MKSVSAGMCRASVSIPLKSGHWFNIRLPNPVRPPMVSIPLKSGHWFNTSPEAGKAIHPSLNPFEIRALVQSDVLATEPAIKVSIPLKSGHWFNSHSRGLAHSCLVSIPLKSGHWFNKHHCGMHTCTMGLNPFEIRALVQSRVRLHNPAPLKSQSL